VVKLKTMKISVLMPVYNAEKYIEAAVDSILKQTFTDFEFIIINDGSTDGTLDILEGYAKRDSRIRLISRENKGLVATLNEGLALAKAPLIARMDADDVSVINRLMLQKEYLDEHADILCVSGDYEVIDEKGRVVTRLKVPVEPELISSQLLKGHSPMVHPATMFRKRAIDEVGPYSGNYLHAEDYDLWLRFDEIGKLANLPELLLRYRYSTSSVSWSNMSLQLASAKRACEHSWERRGLIDGVFEPVGDWRPNESNQSRYDFSMKMAWWAYSYNQLSTSFFYGVKAVGINVLKKQGWVLLLSLIRKKLKL